MVDQWDNCYKYTNGVDGHNPERKNDEDWWHENY